MPELPSVTWAMSHRGRHLAAALTAIVFGLLAACGAPAQPEANGREPVVVTFSVLGDLVRNVGGDYVTVTVLAGGGVDSHTFSPSAADGAALAGAHLVFENGLGFEPWLDDLYRASGSHAALTVVTEGLPLITANWPTARGAGGDQSGLQSYDPHVWHSAANAITMTQKIRDALVLADPANAAALAVNADAYSAQLTDLDARIRAMVETVPAENRVLVTSHDSLGYFAHAYGFTIAGSAFGSLSTEAADPSAGEIADLIEQIKATGVPAIFAENVENSELMEQIARDAGVSLAPTLFTDALSAEDGDAPTYIALMTWNATAIVTALGGSAG